jgi:hypothetical protein
MEEDFIESQGLQRTVALEMKVNVLYTAEAIVSIFLTVFLMAGFFKSYNSKVISVWSLWGRFPDLKYPK